LSRISAVVLEQGQRIAVKNAPTHFGPTSYEIASDAEHDAIKAQVHLPGRSPPQTVLRRIRHPRGKPIRAVTVNGSNWTAFDRDKEIIRLLRQTGVVAIEAKY
jgi:hypothetical protein